MRVAYTLLLVCCVLLRTNAQTAEFKEEYHQIMASLNAEDWQNADKLAQKLLDYCEHHDDVAGEQLVLRYIHIYATAGLLNEKKLTKDEALKNVLYLKGKEIIIPPRLFNSNCHVNCMQLASEAKNTFFTGTNNNAGTQIFSFEYVTIKDGIKEAQVDLEGKYISVKGVLKDISAEGNMLPRFKLMVNEGQYLIETEEAQEK